MSFTMRQEQVNYDGMVTESGANPKFLVNFSYMRGWTNREIVTINQTKKTLD